jgi:hypothetical protein
MAYLLSNSITYSQAFIGNLTPTVYTGNEPAMTTANTIVSLILNPPFTWPWNRATTTATLTQGTQDYSVQIANFGFLEKVGLTYTLGGTSYQNEIEAVYNNKPLGLTNQQSRPEFVAVQYQGEVGSPPGEGVTFRFLNSPDQAYTATFIYQQAPVFFTATSQDWLTECGIPYSFIDVFNSLFLSEMYRFSDDAGSAAIYRQRGMAALLSKASALTEMQRNEILAYSISNDLQTLAANLRTQQASQARGI